MTRSVLITGCSSGIGLDAAVTLHRRGWQVFATARKPADRARLEGMGIEAPYLDYAEPDSIAAALAHATDRTGGRLDAVFNNGAHAVPGAAEDLPPDALRAILEVNVIGWHDLTRRAIPVMRAQGHGRIVNCSSVLGLVPMRWRSAYVASKFAVEGLTDTLRLEMRDTPIHVITLQPGPVTSRIRVNSIPHFETWIDWRASARCAQYEATLLDRLYGSRGPDRFERPPSAVTAKLIHALEAPRPKARYRVTAPTHAMALLRHLLPASALDWLIARG